MLRSTYKSCLWSFSTTYSASFTVVFYTSLAAFSMNTYSFWNCVFHRALYYCTSRDTIERSLAPFLFPVSQTSLWAILRWVSSPWSLPENKVQPMNGQWNISVIPIKTYVKLYFLFFGKQRLKSRSGANWCQWKHQCSGSNLTKIERVSSKIIVS